MQKVNWQALLKEAAEAGILEHLGGSTYKIHPALPWYLRQRLSEQYAVQEVRELEKKLLLFYVVLAENYRKELIGNAELASFVLRAEEPNLLQNLRLAEQQQSWADAQAILQALGEVYQRIDCRPKFKALRQRVLGQIGSHLSEAKGKGWDAFNFWMYLRGVDANEAARSADLKKAGAIYQEILDELTALNDSSVNDKIAGLLYSLGFVAKEKRNFEEALNHFQNALKIYEDVGDVHSGADVYFQLGRIAYLKRDFEGAINYYRKYLQILDEVGDEYKAAAAYQELGRIELERFNFERAINYYQQASLVYTKTGNLNEMAGIYHQMGLIAYSQSNYKESIKCHYKALQAYENAGDLYRAAGEYHQLGVMAHDQGYFAQDKDLFEEANNYYQKALRIYKDFEDKHKTASVYQQLGRLAQDHLNFEEAINYYQQAIQIFEKAVDYHSAASNYYLLGTVAQAQQELNKARNYYQKALEVFKCFQDWHKASLTLGSWGNVLETQEKWTEALQIYLKALAIDCEHNEEWISSDIQNLGRMLKQLGESQFDAVWREVMGEDCAGELREAIWAAWDNLEIES